MEDLTDQLNDFNELHNLGMEFLTRLEDAVKFAEKERDDAKKELEKACSENKNLSAKLAECQEKLKVVERERDELRGKLDALIKILAR